MGFQPIRERAMLRSAKVLNREMKRTNLGGSDLARLAMTTPETISKLRRGQRASTTVQIARNIERKLGVRVGLLFDYAEEGV